MKEQFRLFWQCNSKREGARFLGWWIIQAIESSVEQLERTARTLLYHFEDLLSYFEHGIDNGKAEGINNKIKVLKKTSIRFPRSRIFQAKTL